MNSFSKKFASMYFFPVKIDFFPLIEYESICYWNTVPPISIKNGALIAEIIFDPAQYWNPLFTKKDLRQKLLWKSNPRKGFL